VIELLRTIEILKTGKVEYEFRTTVVPSFVETEDMNKICEMVKGAKTFVFQQFVSGDTLEESFKMLRPYPREIIEGYADTMKKYVDDVVLRV
jgi:pyruvate formate lyase activating enzyme